MVKIDEYRGVRKLMVAKLTESVDAQTGNVTATYATPVQLAGVQSIGVEVNESSDTHYYDNAPAIVIDGEGEDTYTLTISALTPEMEALINGITYDATHKELIGTKKEKAYFALGFIGKKVSGEEEMTWIYKGKFTGGNKTFQTEDDGTDANNLELTFTSVYTAVEYGKDGKHGKIKYLTVPNDGTNYTETWLDTVSFPDATA